MKIFVVILAFVALAAGGAVLHIPGYDHTKVGYAADDAPMCDSDNFFCLLPDSIDATVFYRCVSVGQKAVKHQCMTGRNFIFTDQLCGMPTEWCVPKAPYKCSEVGSVCKK